MLSVCSRVAARTASLKNVAPSASAAAAAAASSCVGMSSAVTAAGTADAPTKVTLIEGRCVGPEIVSVAANVLDSIGAPFEFIRMNFDFEGLASGTLCGTSVSANVAKSVRDTKYALMGAVTCPIGDGYVSPARLLRCDLDLDHFIVKVKSYKGVKNAKFDNVDVVLFRDNTRGSYMGLEHMPTPTVAESLTVHDWHHITALAQAAFKYASDEGRSKVTCIHKANIIKKTDGLFLRACEAVSKKFPGIEFEPMIVDNTCMQLVSRPDRFDVLVAPNMYGAIVSNVLAGLVGSPGMSSGVNTAADGSIRIYEQGVRQGGSASAREIANPAGTLFAAAQLLRDSGSVEMGDKLEAAVEATIASGAGTADIGGTSTANSFASEVVRVYGQ